MKKIFALIPCALMFMLVLSTASVSGIGIKEIEEMGKHWYNYDNCWNLGAGYSWCEFEKNSFDKEVEKNGNMHVNEKEFNTLYFFKNGEIIAKTNVHSQVNSLIKQGLTQTEVERTNSFPLEAEDIGLIYIPDYFIKILKKEIQILKGIPPVCGPEGC